MYIKPIKSEKDYEATLQKIEKLWDAKMGSPEGDILEVLTILVEDYEKEHYDIFPPGPIGAILYRMEQLGMKQKDLGKLVGGANRASELLHGKRQLTVKMINNLRKELNIPAESLLGL